MQLHNLKRNTKRKYSRSVGRGGTRGKTSGRGTKGQKARAGHKIRPEFRDVLMRMPKLRGTSTHGDFKSLVKKSVPIKLDKIEKNFAGGETVSLETLAQKKLIGTRHGKMPSVKVLSDGEITKKVNIKGVAVSAGARAKIEKAGGKIE